MTDMTAMSAARERTWSSKTVDDKKALVQGRQKDHLPLGRG